MLSILRKKEIAAEHDTSAKDEKINRLTEQVHELQAEQLKWRDERSALRKTIDKLQSQVRGLTDQLSAIKTKYDKVMRLLRCSTSKRNLIPSCTPLLTRKNTDDENTNDNKTIKRCVAQQNGGI